jgi:subfamily B ATP-binding cassette protein MsbA
MVNKFVNLNFVKDIRKLLIFMRKTDIRKTYFFLSVSISFIAVFFNAAQIGILIPLLRGIIERNFDFLENIPVFKQLVAAFPDNLSNINSRFLLVLLAIVGVALIHNGLKYASGICIRHQIRIANRNIRQSIFSRFLMFGKLYFDRKNVGQLNTLLMHHSGSVTNQLKAIEKLLSEFFSLIAYLIILLMISWKLSVLIVLIFPTMNLISMFVVRNVRKIARVQMNVRGQLDRNIFNILTCIPLVKASAQEEEEAQKFLDINTEEVSATFNMSRMEQLIAPIQNISSLFALLALVSMFHFVIPINTTGETSKYLIFFFITMRIAPTFNAINKFGLALSKASSAMEWVLNVIAEDDDKFIVEDGHKEFTSLNQSIDIRGMTFEYLPKVPVLSNLSFSIKEGEVTAIVGPTGSGKSTIVHLLMRFYDAPAKSIFIDGHDIREFTLKSLRRNISLVSQDVLLFNDTLRTNISYGCGKDITDGQLDQAAKDAGLYNFIQTLPEKYETIVGDKGIRLSGGERQRTSIARALLKNSKLLILDEATSSLDSKTENLIQSSIESVIEGRTTIVIAHRLSTIRKADKIIVLDKGGVVEQGSLEELIKKKSAFYEYWEAQKISDPS